MCERGKACEELSEVIRGCRSARSLRARMAALELRTSVFTSVPTQSHGTGPLTNEENGLSERLMIPASSESL